MAYQRYPSIRGILPEKMGVLLLIVVSMLPLLAGCVRVKATLTISPDDLVSGQIIALAKPRNNDDHGPQFNSHLPFAQKVNISPYRSDELVGQQAIFSGLTFSELPQLAELNNNATGVNITLRRAGNVVILEGRVDLTLLHDPSANIDFNISFPGEVISTNGRQVSDSAVTWHLKPGVVNTMIAQAHYTDPSTRLFFRSALWMVIAAVVTSVLVGWLAWYNRNLPPPPPREYRRS